MSEPSADVIAALVAILKADAGVAALVGTYVFGSELPADVTAEMPRKAVVLEPSGGVSLAAGSYLEHDSQRVDAFNYGETPYQAARLRRAVHDVFKHLRQTVAAETLVHWVEPAGGFTDGRDRETGWPTAFESFQAYFAEPPVTA